MALFLITYDLRKPGRNYAALYDLLGKTWQAAKIAESVWLAELKGPAPAIRKLIVATVDGNDRIAVIQLRAPFDWAIQEGGLSGRNLFAKGTALLKRYSP
jgi:hypothetical protein